MYEIPPLKWAEPNINDASASDKYLFDDNGSKLFCIIPLNMTSSAIHTKNKLLMHHSNKMSGILKSNSIYLHNNPKLIRIVEHKNNNLKVVIRDFASGSVSLLYNPLFINSIMPTMVLSKFKYMENGIECGEIVIKSIANAFLKPGII